MAVGLAPRGSAGGDRDHPLPGHALLIWDSLWVSMDLVGLIPSSQ